VGFVDQGYTHLHDEFLHQAREVQRRIALIHTRTVGQRDPVKV